MKNQVHWLQNVSHLESDSKTHIYVLADPNKEVVVHYCYKPPLQQNESVWYRAGKKIASETCTARFRGGLPEAFAYVGVADPRQREDLILGFLGEMEAEIRELFKLKEKV